MSTMEDGPQILPPPTMEPISRPSSTSTSASASLPQLPGISSLAAATASPSNPQQMNRPSNGQQQQQPQQQQQQYSQQQVQPPPPPMYTGASPAATSGGTGGNMPTCQNCSTSTTPLWRRDEFGSVLCNACGLFLKLHGRPRPISLKTDVIKSRNRVKAMRPDMAPKKKQQAQTFPGATDHNGLDMSGQNAQAARRASQKSANGQHDGSDSPISRTGTPSMYNHSLPSFMVDDTHQGAGVAGFGASGASDGQGASPMNGDRNLDAPQTHEQLIAQNSSLKTRVSELDLINELFRGRLSQLEQQEAAARRGQELACVEQTQLRTKLDISEETTAQLRAQLDDSHRRENNLKRRLDELELELKEAKEALEAESGRPAKKPRVEEPRVEEPRVEEPRVEEPRVEEPAMDTDITLTDASHAADLAKATSEIVEAADVTEAANAADVTEKTDNADQTETVDVADTAVMAEDAAAPAEVVAETAAS